MSNQSQLMSFNIEKWSANSAGLNSDAEWQAWSTHLDWPQDGSTEFKAIPPMMRRRMSLQSKLAVQTALTLLKDTSIDYLVFASRHGELHRTATLIQSILEGDDASPMAFSQSVHNTAAGLTTIAAKAPIPLTSIAAGQDTFHNALIEAYLYLHQYPSHRVLVIDFDQPLPELYQEFETQSYADYALGLVLTAGCEYSISRVTDAKMLNAEDSLADLPQALKALHNILQKTPNWTIAGKQQQWSWVNNVRSEAL
ncbi:beta-ketoacyl synthase chain length factor [Vibrio sp. ED004]|uniref:beta-ketoacyl synthase chain length factor n=1 Tax=unclassified Vibrio TaxID=2614977 RepID=UPI000FFBB0A1|nr:MULTISPECIES: beta-ketoacyl synthase chain length factor [unclassified Vibrio]UPR55893.1 beta-ketoacyl synthase chain length factor [Vibrio sp. ED004]